MPINVILHPKHYLVGNFCSHSVSAFFGLFGVGFARLGDRANSVSIRDAAAQENEL